MWRQDVFWLLTQLVNRVSFPHPPKSNNEGLMTKLPFNEVYRRRALAYESGREFAGSFIKMWGDFLPAASFMPLPLSCKGW